VTDQPRLLERPDAAAYCSLTVDGFSAWVRSGRLPAALPGTKRWDRKAIDEALDRLSGLAGDRESGIAGALDSWRKGRTP